MNLMNTASSSCTPRKQSQVQVKHVSRMNVDEIDKLPKLFRTVHTKVENARPFSDFEWLCALDQAKGFDVFQNSNFCFVFNT